MAVHMEKMSDSSASEIAQRLYDKNVELENKRRRSAQAKVPSDPNSWQQMRENYEAIILEDHAFSEQKNIEYALWHLHYRRIEEFRAHINAAQASNASTTSQGVKVPPRPDRTAKIRVQFKTFLSEATGFYHDLILKIRSKYGLPLGVFSDESENSSSIEKDRKRSAEMKKGIISCHRCLIYLGDLARYKGLYGESDCKARDYAAASSYYLQALSILPSSGNPHHQLAILATYSGDELLAVYRYFRSLTVDFPFTTARENLIVAFEKNRQNYSQLLANGKTVTNGSPIRRTNKGKVKMEMKPNANVKADASISKEKGTCSREICKTFTTRFVRLNGILFTRTSLETFPEVLSEVSNDLNKLLSTGAEEVLDFGVDTSENEGFIIRLVSILISTVHNVTREGEGQTYADILQRTVLLQNALTAVFELLGHVLNRCTQLLDPCSSCLLPGILVYVEWLASCPDVAASSDLDKKQASARSVFWNHCVSFLNKLSAGMVDMDDEDDSCFSKTNKYKEGDNETRLALCEDVELRGFLPLQPAQAILDFSRKHSFGGDSRKEKIARVKRILAAGKALSNVVKVDHKTFAFDLQLKKFTIGTNPQTSEDLMPSSRLGSPQPIARNQEVYTEATFKEVVQPTAQILMDEEDEDDEVIVFRPAINENRSDIVPSKTTIQNGVDGGGNAFLGDSKYYKGLLLAEEIGSRPQAGFVSSLPIMQNSHPTKLESSIWSMNQPTSLVSDLEVTNSLDKVIMKPGVQETMAFSNPSMFPTQFQQSTNGNVSNVHYSSRGSVPFPDVNPTTSAVITSTAALPSSMRKSPVKRPVRHHGPPPGFGSVPPKLANEIISGTNVAAAGNHHPLMDDYSWLDGYQPPLSMGALGLNQSINYPIHSSAHYNNLGSMMNTHFPFPGKQAVTKQQQQQFPPVEKQNGWEDLLAFDRLKLQEQLQQPQQLMNGSQQFHPPLHSMWTGGHYPV
ncbi:nonsense-mediated mRNA decay factor SMG7-like [Impatiens glandulifera]|uniref:nonsense-mediated mRNA decay factor SMG7-like n=1 Tax=Impatiens glandulifera TaxID=253017 RepID=UPI001FB10893|nr:nonsense-mediated mRNA decay factor SMG7-like [Impatiens glandulifera]XP_047329140.1 nonsense-mediated mRNA decay factor SMG7-like [Impatiens glandulifera]